MKSKEVCVYFMQMLAIRRAMWKKWNTPSKTKRAKKVNLLIKLAVSLVAFIVAVVLVVTLRIVNALIGRCD